MYSLCTVVYTERGVEEAACWIEVRKWMLPIAEALSLQGRGVKGTTEECLL